MISDRKFASMLRAARKRNRKMDIWDSEAGFAFPSRCPNPVVSLIDTAMAAIRSGIHCEDKDYRSIMEGYALLEEALGVVDANRAQTRCDQFG